MARDMDDLLRDHPGIPRIDNSISPEEQHRKVQEGEGFFAPMPPNLDAVRSYLEVYLLQRQEWEEAPELGVLNAPFDDSVTGYAFPIPEGTWDAMHEPGKVLRLLARLLWKDARTDHALLRPVDRTQLADMVGVYFRHEGWAPPRGQELRALKSHSQGIPYRFEDAKDRRECRAITAVMVDGSVVRATQFRDEKGDIRSGSYHLLKDSDDPTKPGPASWVGGDHLIDLLKISYGLIAYMRPAHANNIGGPEGGVPVDATEVASRVNRGRRR